MRHLFFYQRGRGVVFLVELTRKKISISGYPNVKADICIVDHRVGRQHATLIRRRQSYVVRDLGSHHGTYVNDQRVESRQRLEDGDVIRFHQYPASYHQVLPDTEHELLAREVFETGDAAARAVYGDWLEDHGLRFEADAMRGVSYCQIL